MKNMKILEIVDSTLQNFQPLVSLTEALGNLLVPNKAVHASCTPSCLSDTCAEYCEVIGGLGQCKFKTIKYSWLSSCTSACDHTRCYNFGVNCSNC
jgi:hypothetical protein